MLLALAGCSGVPFPEFEPVESESSRLFLHASLSNYQAQARVIERATFVLGGEEVVLTLYAVSEGPRSLRLAALSDLGSTVFGFEWTPSGLEVLQSSPNFQPALVAEIARDQALALLPPSLDVVELVRLQDGRTALYYEAFGSEVLASVGAAGGSLQLECGQGGDSSSTILLLGDGFTEQIEVRTRSEAYSARMQVGPWEADG
jgi:hypothetical protein